MFIYWLLKTKCDDIRHLKLYMPSPNSSFDITIKPQGTESYTATAVILHPTKKLCYCKLRVLKLYYQTPYHAIKWQGYKKTHSGWSLNFLLPFIFYCMTDCKRIKVVHSSGNRFLICSLQVLHMKHYEERSFLFISSQYTHSQPPWI